MSITTLSQFDPDELSHISQPIVIEFYVTWCPKCAMMKSVYEQVSQKLESIIRCYKIDADLIPEQVKELGVHLFPTFIVYHHGQILGFTTGLLSATSLESRIRQILF